MLDDDKAQEIQEEETFYAGHLGIPDGWDHADDEDDLPYEPALGGGFI